MSNNYPLPIQIFQCNNVKHKNKYNILNAKKEKNFYWYFFNIIILYIFDRINSSKEQTAKNILGKNLLLSFFFSYFL